MSGSKDLGMEFDLPKNISSIIKVIGVGGGGSNAVNHMFNLGIKGVDFVVCNTDKQALDVSAVPFKIQLGTSLTEGNGAGAIPEVGRNAAIENIDEITDLLGKQTKMVFVTAGMGGGTGTGAAPVIAGIARELGILTVGIVTVPFGFEGRKRRQQAEEGLEEMRKNVDTLLVINNEKLREMTGNLTINNAFSKADDVLTVAAKGIAELISVTGSVNVDFNDVYTVMKDSGVAIMGSAAVDGEERALRCVQEAMNSPLLNDNNIFGAKYVLLNITYGDKEVLMDEISQITDYIQDEAGSTADVIWGHGYDPSLGDKLCVTLIATGFKTSPLTGVDKAPEKVVLPLEPEAKKEITQPLQNPTEQNQVQNPVNNNVVEPYIKSEQTVANQSTANFTQPEVKQVVVEPKTVESIQEVNNPELIWEIDTNATQVQPEIKPVGEPEKIVHQLESDDVYNLEQATSRTAKVAPSQDEQIRLNAERMQRIQEYTQKLKKADGLSELEKEPAYIRRNIHLDQSKPSLENNNSRFGVSGNGDNNLRSNNSFLHDNVD
ncbi:MAG: cell division protein FtsZ [Crocinitomicaceae bacterium]|jgi:cell division protein FtsZ